MFQTGRPPLCLGKCTVSSVGFARHGLSQSIAITLARVATIAGVLAQHFPIVVEFSLIIATW